MPTLPAAHPARMIAAGLLLEALLLTIFKGFAHPPSTGIPMQDPFQLVESWIPAVACAFAGAGLIAGKRWAWWLGLGLATAMVVTTPGALLATIRYFVPAGMEGARKFVAGLVMLGLAKMGWHLMLGLGLLHKDVREHLGMAHWDAASALTMVSLVSVAWTIGALAVRVAIGW